MKKLLLIITIVYSACIHTLAQSGKPTTLIFDTDFDNKPDWAAQHASQKYSFPGDVSNDGNSGYVAGSNIPLGFDFYRCSEIWHPNGDKNGNDTVHGSEPVAQINNREGSHLSPTGKALIITDEAWGSNGDWGTDGILTKDLGAEYNELWVEIWVKFQPNYQWESVLKGISQSRMKFFRVRRYSGISTTHRYSFFGEHSRSGSPVAIFDFKEWATTPTTSITRGKFYLYGYSLPSEYQTANDYYTFKGNYDGKIETSIKQGGSKSLNWVELFGDDQYHKINFYLKMDAAPGSGDGVAELWIDDVLELRVDDIPWREVGDPDIGWNELSIGGNAQNVWAPESEHPEQWYAVSSLKVWANEVVTDIKEQEDIEIQVYPNPASDHVTINGLSLKGKTTIVLSNTLGQQVGETMSFTGEKSVQITTAHLSEGIYLLTVVTNNQQFTARVVR